MSEQLVHVTPDQVLAEGNVRWNLKPSRVDALATSILESGGVLTPIEIEPLVPVQNSFKYRLTSGFYRHAAVSKLNAEQNAGLTIPAMVRKTTDATERLKHQLAENMERENQSPMDQAIAISRLIEAGISRGEIRRIFARPGGQKGTTIQPASNAWVNITLRFLELSKSIQDKIHDGRVSMAAAYELGKVPPDKRAAVLERAEKERLHQVEVEEGDERKYIAAEQKLFEAQASEREAVAKLTGARTEVEVADKLVDEKTAVLKTIQKEPYLEYDEKGKSDLKERLKAAEADVKGATKISKDAKNDVAKLHAVAKKSAEVAEEQRAKLEAARKAVKAKPKRPKTVGPGDLKNAARAEGAIVGAKPLNLSEVKQALKDVIKLKTHWPKVAAIALAVIECCDSVTTPKELGIQLSYITGESKAPTVAAQPSAPVAPSAPSATPPTKARK